MPDYPNEFRQNTPTVINEIVAFRHSDESGSLLSGEAELVIELLGHQAEAGTPPNARTRHTTIVARGTLAADALQGPPLVTDWSHTFRKPPISPDTARTRSQPKTPPLLTMRHLSEVFDTL